jgi:hypothetical protein
MGATLGAGRLVFGAVLCCSFFVGIPSIFLLLHARTDLIWITIVAATWVVGAAALAGAIGGLRAGRAVRARDVCCGKVGGRGLLVVGVVVEMIREPSTVAEAMASFGGLIEALITLVLLWYLAAGIGYVLEWIALSTDVGSKRKKRR